MNFLINWTFGSWIWIVECVVRQNFGKHPNLYPRAYHFYKWYNTHIWYDDFKQGVSHDLLFALSFGHLPFCFAYPMVVTLLKFSNKRTIKVAKRCVVLLSRFPSIATMHSFVVLLVACNRGGVSRSWLYSSWWLSQESTRRVWIKTRVGPIGSWTWEGRFDVIVYLGLWDSNM